MSELKVLFISGNNSGSSQLAQRICAAYSDKNVISAYTETEKPRELHPVATKILNEMGDDNSPSTPFSEAISSKYDVVITLDDAAAKRVPLRLPGNPYRLRWDIGDLADISDAAKQETAFRNATEYLRLRVSDLLSRAENFAKPAAMYRQPGIASGQWAKEVLSERHIEQIAKVGFKAIEISPYSIPEHFDFRDVDHIRRIRQAAQDNGVMIWSLHSRDVGDLSSPDPAERQIQIDHLRDCLDAADMLGAAAVVSHIQVIARHFADRKSAESRLAEGMNALAPRADISTARIAIENGYAFEDGRWTRDVFERVDPLSPNAFGYVIDTGHTNVAGDFADVEAGVGERLISLHLNDNAGKDTHWVCGEGTVDWARVAKLLHDTNYDGCLMWEIGNPAKYFDLERINKVMDGHKRFMEFMENVQ